MNNKVILILLISLILISGCNKNNVIIEPKQDLGKLEGKISIGPICPVERNPPDPNCKPTEETYKAYALGVFINQGKITNINPDKDGNFKLDLLTGNYKIDFIQKQERTIVDGIPLTGGSSNLPIQFEIKKDEITNVEINIDTGIR